MVTGPWAGAANGFAVLVHGGAGVFGDASRAAREASCRAAAGSARAILMGGGSALDAVQRAVEMLEDDPLLNAGTGAALTREGHIELDAAIMQGRGLRAGAVCALPPFRHPVAIARCVLEDGKHALYAAAGAEAFARRHGFVPAAEADMVTELSRSKLARALAGEDSAGGTVGAVAIESSGDVAAATSTGGISGKYSGRVGDSPLLGAGTYADAKLGAASATGHGEGILRVLLTFRALQALGAGATPEMAARTALETMEREVGSTGGLILVGADGRLAVAHTTAAMPWAAALDDASEITGS